MGRFTPCPRGREPERVSDAAEPAVVGVDVGGTKVAAGRVVGARAVEIAERPTDLNSSAALLDEIEAAVRETIDRTGPVEAVGLGVPSQIEFERGLVVTSVNIPLEGVPLRDELGARLGTRVYVDNDANCAALAEAQFTEDAPAQSLVMLTLGTGVGGGVVIDGAVFRGATGLGAELGHVVVEADGRKCPGRTCPNRGCLEAYCSGTALGLAGSERFGREVTGVEVVAAARQGDPDSLAVLTDLGTWLGVAVASFVNVFEPEYIVIGGGLSVAADLFLDTAIAEAGSRALPAGFERVSIVRAKGGPDAGVIGAGLLAQKEHALSRSEVDTARTTTLEGGS